MANNMIWLASQLYECKNNNTEQSFTTNEAGFVLQVLRTFSLNLFHHHVLFGSVRKPNKGSLPSSPSANCITNAQENS